MNPQIGTDLVQIALQEEQLQFDTFIAQTVWQLRTLLKPAPAR